MSVSWKSEGGDERGWLEEVEQQVENVTDNNLNIHPPGRLLKWPGRLTVLRFSDGWHFILFGVFVTITQLILSNNSKVSTLIIIILPC